jgi:glyoxylase-like metal-dependent hydrolase (beta-lactamase superfamily II)
MKYFKGLFVFITVLFLIPIAGHAEYKYKLDLESPLVIGRGLSVEKITEGVVMAVHAFPWSANSLVVEMEDTEIVLIDTPYTYEATKELVEWIRGLAGDEVHLTAINTGFHFDNLGGNQYLKEQGIPIYGTSKTKEMIQKRGEKSRNWNLQNLKGSKYKEYYDVYKDQACIPPTDVFDLNADEEKKLSFGAESLILYYPGETHSPDNITVYYPEKKILFGGCMIKESSAVNLGNTDDANLGMWPASIERLKAKYKDANVKIVIPGHGKAGDLSLLDKTLELCKKQTVN